MIKIQTTTKELSQILAGCPAELDIQTAVEKFAEWFNEDGCMEGRFYEFLYDGEQEEEIFAGISLLKYLYNHHGYCVKPSAWVLSKDPLSMKEKTDGSEEVIFS